MVLYSTINENPILSMNMKIQYNSLENYLPCSVVMLGAAYNWLEKKGKGLIWKC